MSAPRRLIVARTHRDALRVARPEDRTAGAGGYVGGVVVDEVLVVEPLPATREVWAWWTSACLTRLRPGGVVTGPAPTDPDADDTASPAGATQARS